MWQPRLTLLLVKQLRLINCNRSTPAVLHKLGLAGYRLFGILYFSEHGDTLAVGPSVWPRQRSLSHSTPLAAIAQARSSVDSLFHPWLGLGLLGA